MAEEEKMLGQASQGRGKETLISASERKALLSDLKQAEGMIRNDIERETVVVFDREGVGFFAKRQEGLIVDMESEVRKDRTRFEGAILTHNHPHNTSFSLPDIDLACWARLSEIRVTCREYDYTFRNSKGDMSEDWWSGEIEKEFSRVSSSVSASLLEEGIPVGSEEYNMRLSHEVWKRLADNSSVEYTRVERHQKGRHK